MDAMNLLLNTVIGMGALVAAQAAETQNAAPIPKRPEPCYVVIAVDISTSVEATDSPSGLADRGLALRDEGQLIFLQLLPFLRSDLYLGVTHFSDRVRYSLPSRETGPLLPWGRTFLSEAACRNLVRPAQPHLIWRSDVAQSMAWASDRIEAARRQYGPGSAKLILLSSGDPRDSAREIERSRGSLLSAAKQFAERKIQVYPILFHDPARAAGGSSRLGAGANAVESLMQSVALVTGGKAYRRTPELDFADILMDVFDLGVPIRGDLVVSPHDWAIVAVGQMPESVTLEPVGGAGSRTMALGDSLEATSGIRANVISSSTARTTILRRPGTRDLAERFWQGHWKLGSAQGKESGSPSPNSGREDPKSPPAVRLYRIPDYLIQLEPTPALPWWLDERVRLQAHLLDRHGGGVIDGEFRAGGPQAPESGQASSVDSTGGLSLRIRASLPEARSTFRVDQGRWTIPGRLYETEPFMVRAPGLYKLAGELRHTVGDVNAPILHFTHDLYVHPACVALEVIRTATNEVLQNVSPGTTKLRIEAQGGQEIDLRLSSTGEFKAEPLSGTVHFESLPQTEWTLRKDDSGRLVAGPIPLMEQEDRLMGSAAVEIRTFAGVRHIQLPAFELAYTPAPLRIECAFTDPRDALWVGELHRQPLTITAFPVFDTFLDQTLGLFPETLSEARIRTIDMRSGAMQVVGPENRLLERPQPGGYAGRTVSATYFIESTTPIPPGDKCEIDLSNAVQNLQGAIKTYAVVDPQAKGLFEWIVQQGDSAQRAGPVSETLFTGEPVLFFAEWRPDQNVSAVRFEIPQTNSAGPIFVDLPVIAGTSRAQVQQVVSGLASGEVFPVYVHVTMQPAQAKQALHVKLRGGQFRAEDRRIVLEDLTVGDGTPADISGYLWEPVEIPVRALFRGYKADDPAHIAAVEQFKTSCVVTVTPRGGEPKNITDAIEWTSVTPPEGAASVCRLAGRVRYTPEILGRAAVELNVPTPLVRGATRPASQRAYVHVLTKEPRLALTVRRLKPGGEEPVFDSRSWVRGPSGQAPLTTRLSTRLRVELQSINWAPTGQSQSWQATLRLLRRTTSQEDWAIVFSDTGELAENQPLLREVQIAENGQYALEVVGRDPQSNRQTAYLLTPIIASIQPHEIRPVVTPGAWLTSRVRQWPFEYVVTLYQDAVDLSRLQALAFQFQLPGQSDLWLNGAAAPIGSQGGQSRHLSAKGPRLLPAVEALRDGAVRFRLSSQGLEILRWECPDIRVIPPVLEGLALSRESTGAALASSDGALAVDGSADLWVRPVFRVAPEVEGQWAASETMVYLWRHPPDGAAGGPADARVLERLLEHGQGASKPEAAGARIQAFEIKSRAGLEAVKVVPRRAGHGFWGWPRRAVREQYSLIASVVYRPREAGRVGSDPTASQEALALPVLAEWSDLYAINLNAPWVVPMCWWPVLAILLMAIVAMGLRLLVPSPSRLALDLRLEENVATVEPVRLDNPVLVDLQETPLAQEVVLYTRYLCGRWDHAGRKIVRQAGLPPESTIGAVFGGLLYGVAAVLAPVWVLLRRSLYPRRWAWAAVIPRLRGNVALARTGLLCVWTGLGARRGRVWSSQGGTITLPQEGQTRSIDLDLPYRIDSVDRTMRVTVRVRKMVAEEIV